MRSLVAFRHALTFSDDLLILTMVVNVKYTNSGSVYLLTAIYLLNIFWDVEELINSGVFETPAARLAGLSPVVPANSRVVYKPHRCL